MLWLKALHIIFVVTWFAGLFYLPRLFVYHTEVSKENPMYQRFCVMEHKLFWAIMTPSAILTVLFGGGLLTYWHHALTQSGWLHTKILLVAFLIVYHIFCWRHMKNFKQQNNQKTHVYYRIFNEIPAVILVMIVFLVVLKPF